MTNKRLYQTRQAERGNMLFLILIAAALFAALSYVVAQSSRSGGGDAARDKARLAAADIMNQATAVQTSVGRLLIGGCLDTDLSFESGNDTVHVNPGAPVDNHCHVFHPAGGGTPPRQADPQYAGDPRFYYVSSSAITNIATTCTDPSCADLTMNLYDVGEVLCEELNTANGYRVAVTDLPTDTQAGCPFEGTYDCAGNGNAEIVFASPELRGKNSVCYRDTVKGLTFTHVILER